VLYGKERSVLDAQAAKCQQRCEFIFLYCIGKQTEFQLMVLVATSEKNPTFWKIRDGARNNYESDLRAWKLPCSEIFKEISLFTLSKRCLRSDLITAYLHREKISGALKRFLI